MAQVALARKDQKPELALAHLRTIDTRSPAVQSIVKLNEGKAFSALGKYRSPSKRGKRLLRIDPMVPEAGWALLGLYYVQGRREDAHRLAMRLYQTEPDPRDRAQLLLELLRQDAKHVITETDRAGAGTDRSGQPGGSSNRNRVGVGTDPDQPCRRGAADTARLCERFPNDSDAWDALLIGLDESFAYDEMSTVMHRLPTSIAADPRFAKHRGVLGRAAEIGLEPRSGTNRPMSTTVPTASSFIASVRFSGPRGNPLRLSVSNPYSGRWNRLARSPWRSIPRRTRSRAWARNHIPSCATAWPTSANRWAGRTRPWPGMALS